MIPPDTFSRSESLFSLDFKNFGPIKSRLNILLNFISQFSISRIFGGWHSEILSGFGQGNFIHSLLLSIITHTGIIGFIFLLKFVYKNN